MPEAEQPYLVKQSKGKLHEHTFNIEFAKVLAETEARWLAQSDEYILAERTGTLSSGRADILIDDPQMPAAAIEASFNPKDADKDAQVKLGRKTTRGGRSRCGRFWQSTFPRNIKSFLRIPYRRD